MVEFIHPSSLVCLAIDDCQCLRAINEPLTAGLISERVAILVAKIDSYTPLLEYQAYVDAIIDAYIK